MFESTFLRDISLVWSLFHVLVLFMAFYESRYSMRRTILLTGVFMGGLAVIISVLIFLMGAVWVSNRILFLCTLPSLPFFYIMSAQRDGRFLFTFCLVDTVSLWLIVFTMILSFCLTRDSYILLFVGRLFGFPFFEYLVCWRYRKPYQELQRAVAKGWAPFAGVTAVFFLLLLVASLYPADIYTDPRAIPVLVLLLILMPLMYWNIFQALIRQQRLADAEEEMRILNLQASMMALRIRQSMETEKKLSIYRHDLRHRLQAIAAMLRRGEGREAIAYIAASEESLEEAKARRYCANPVLDAVFTAYFRQAEEAGARVEADLDIPADLPVDAVELSTVFANALENAIHAVRALPKERRVIRCRCIRYPQLMFSISNPYQGKVRFDGNGRPMALAATHGVGTRSIAAYCEKHGAACRYKVRDGWFTLQIVQTIREGGPAGA